MAKSQLFNRGGMSLLILLVSLLAGCEPEKAFVSADFEMHGNDQQGTVNDAYGHTKESIRRDDHELAITISGGDIYKYDQFDKKKADQIRKGLMPMEMGVNLVFFSRDMEEGEGLLYVDIDSLSVMQEEKSVCSIGGQKVVFDKDRERFYEEKGDMDMPIINRSIGPT